MKTEIEALKQKACQIRRELLKMIHTAKSGHPGGALSAADIVTALYWQVMRIRPEEPDWPDRDRFILSKGHACPVLYTALCLKGYFDREHLGRLRRINSILQGHPDMRKTPGIDSTTGSLGNGLSIGIGMALMGKLDKKDYRVYVMLGCGELDEGMIWEAAMCANKYKLDNLCAVVDYNQLQLDGTVDEVMPLEPLSDKWQAFGWNVLRIDGHDIKIILEAFGKAEETKNAPTVIIADTIKGKGVSYMEDICGWHGKAPSDKELMQALQELEEVDL
ncbi:MAG: transketolase [Actinobacteria bacterium]|nr:transketolase [Actinomycetota bacterium]